MKKKIMTLGVIVTMMVAGLGGNTKALAASTTRYGFEYDSSYYEPEFNNGRLVRTYDMWGNAIGIMYYTLGRLRAVEKNTDGSYQDTLLVRMQMDPQKGVKTGYGGEQVAYGVSEYLKVTANLPTTSVNEWAPKNEPSSTTWNIGLGMGFDEKGVSGEISASTEVTVSQLEYEADVQISKKKASFSYDYKPAKSLSWSASKNKYVRNSSTQYAMISYNAKNYDNLVLDFNANFTYADEENARPWNVVFGSEKANSTYTWKIN